MAVPPRQERAAAHVGPYRLGEAIGSGAMAKVLEAIDTRSGQLVALKLLRTHSRGASEAVSRFIREGRALSAIRHPNIVHVFEHGVEDDGTAWLAMERMHGSPLSDLIQHEGRLEAARALRIVIDMAKALATVHARAMIHRDIKPENVFVTFPGSPQEHAKLIDFGVAHVTDQELGEYSCRYTRVGSMLGSAAFMAPEQFDDEVIDARADIFALGVTLYEAITGKLPFDGDTILEQRQARLSGRIVPPHKRVRGVEFAPPLVDLITRMLSPDRERRPPNGVELLKELYRCQQSIAPAPGVPMDHPRRTPPDARSRLSIPDIGQNLRGGASMSSTPANAPPHRGGAVAAIAMIVLTAVALASCLAWLLH